MAHDSSYCCDGSAFHFDTYDEDSRVRYFPCTDGWGVGFRAEHPDGRVEFIYLNPSGGSDDGVPNVFVYHGTTGDPTKDSPFVHFDLFDEEPADG